MRTPLFTVCLLILLADSTGLAGGPFTLGHIAGKPVDIRAQDDPGDGGFIYPRVFLGGSEIYRDTTSTVYDLKSQDNRVVLVPGHPEKTYILLAALDPPDADKWVVLELLRGKVLARHVVIRDFIRNADSLGTKVVGGAEVREGYCLDCDSAYYNPVHVYRLGATFQFDLDASRKQTVAVYGVYLGDKQKDTVLYVKRK